MLVPVTSVIYYHVTERLAAAAHMTLPSISVDVPRDHGDMLVAVYHRASGEIFAVALMGREKAQHMVEASFLTYQELLDTERRVKTELFIHATGGSHEPERESEGGPRSDASKVTQDTPASAVNAIAHRIIAGEPATLGALQEKTQRAIDQNDADKLRRAAHYPPGKEL